MFKRRKARKAQRKAFKSVWIRAQDIQYSDLSCRAEYSEKFPTSQEHLSGVVQQILEECRSILLISEPMAGKTFFAVNYLRKMKDAYVLVPRQDRFDEIYEVIPDAPATAHYKIVLIDDVYSYLNAGVTRLPYFIQNAIETGYIVWANTLSGPEFENVRNHFDPKLLSAFSHLTIPSIITTAEAIKIARTEGLKRLPDDFDGNIGSIFYPISQVKSRYERMDSLERLLLLVIKQLYLVGLYNSNSQILKSRIRQLLDFYESNMSTEVFAQKVDRLIANGFLHNFANPTVVCFEEKYLRTVVAPDLRVKDFMENISRIFPNNVTTYTQAMQAAASYIEAKDIYAEMRKHGIQPGARPFCVLIRKSNNSDEGLLWLNEMDRLGVPIDDYIINALFRVTQGDFEGKDRLMDELKRRGVEVQSKISNFLSAPRILLDLKGYSNLMNLSGDYTKAEKLFNEMIQIGIKPDSVAYNILIKLSGDFEKGKLLLSEMLQKDIKPDQYSYPTLLNLSTSYAKGRELLDECLRNGHPLNDVVYGTLMKLSGEFNACKELLNEMKRSGISINHRRYGFVINLAPTLEDGQKVMDEMIASGVHPTLPQYGTLINLTPDVEKRLQFFEQMIAMGTTPSVEMFGAAINVAGNYKKGQEIYRMMMQVNQEPNAQTFGTLMKLSQDYKIASGLFAEMRAKKIPPTDVVYGTLMSLSRDYSIARDLHSEMKQNQINSNVEIYGTLISLAGNFAKGQELFEEMQEEKIEPNAECYGTLMHLSKRLRCGT